MSAISYYEVLEITESASTEEIRRAYKKLAFEYHPDRNPGDRFAEERFKEINEAYQTLRDPHRRARYDSAGQMYSEGLITGIGFENGFNDIFGTIFEEVFHTRSRYGGKRGNDLRYRLDISFDESVTGTRKTITLNRGMACGECRGAGAPPGGIRNCPACGGAGRLKYKQGFFTLERLCQTCGGKGRLIINPCSACGGQKKIYGKEDIEINVPPGVYEGATLRVRGEGDLGSAAGKNGDLYIEIGVEPHPLFSREGKNIYCDLRISMVRAALGGELHIPTPYGTQKVKIPPGTQSGRIFRLKDMGAPGLKDSRNGDLLLRTVVEVPVNLEKNQKKLLEEFSKSCNRDNNPDSEDFSDILESLSGKDLKN